MPTHPSQSSIETAQTEQKIIYVRQMLGELGAVARSENADMLCYLIEMAYLEAGAVLEGTQPLSMVRKST